MIIDPHPIDVELASLPADAAPEQRLAVIWRHFASVTGHQWTGPPTTDQRQRVYEWLRSLNRGIDGDRAPTFLLKRHRLVSAASMSPRSKASTLSQFSCGTCDAVQDADGNYGRMFPIEVDPWSAQADRSRNRKLKAAVKTMLQTHYRGQATPDLPICVSVVSLVPRAQKRKDVDNLLKGLLDCLSAVAYADDAQIQCLTSRRLEYAGETGLYLVRLRAVRPWDADTVWDDPAPPNVGWGGGPITVV